MSQSNNQEKVLYWNIGSQPGRAVKCLLDIGKIQCKLISIDLFARGTRTKQYLDIYPLGKIPYFTKGKLGIGQSNAIMIYLWETQQTIPRTYYGQTPQARSKVNQYLSWYQNYYRPKMFKLVILFLGSFLLGKPIYENQKLTAQKEVNEALQTLDKLLEIQLKNGKFIASDNPTIADLLIFFQTTNLVYFGRGYEKYPNIQKWFKNVYLIKEVNTITHQWYPLAQQFAQMFKNVQVKKAQSKL